MSIFATPERDEDSGPKILFLHGLEGSSQGSKATHLKKVWGAHAPSLRTSKLYDLKKSVNGKWDTASREDIDEALSDVYQDAVDAVNYLKPDIVVGSSMGGALLHKMYAEDVYDGAGIFLAPASPILLSSEVLSVGTHKIQSAYAFWVLAELDEIVPNDENKVIAKRAQGNLIFSPNDDHRLAGALANGLIDAAILSAVENMNTEEI